MSPGPMVLGVETSCDDTSAAVVDGGLRVHSSIVGSQDRVHRVHGGVVPELASRRHSEDILPVIDAALREAEVDLGDIDLVAVTRGPGLVGSLLVGFMAAKGLAWGLDIPLVGVNHMAAHLWAAALDSGSPELPSPAVCLVVSGGHTDLLHLDDGVARHLGGTRDDAVGEAYDKVARILDLGYPGGPIIDELASSYRGPRIDLPRPMMESGDLDFSFSGLKTAVSVAMRDADSSHAVNVPEMFAASFQDAAVDVLVAKTVRALYMTGSKHLIAAGGVAANSLLRSRLGEAATRLGVGLNIPPVKYCTDNAAMVAAAGYRRFADAGADAVDIDVDPSLGFRSDGGDLVL